MPEPVFGEVQLFNSSATGWAVQLPEWKYPIVCDVTSANIAYDNYNGRWGDPVQLERFQQAYAVEKAKIESRLRGHTCLEQTLTDGSIKLTINVGGAA